MCQHYVLIRVQSTYHSKIVKCATNLFQLHIRVIVVASGYFVQCLCHNHLVLPERVKLLVHYTLAHCNKLSGRLTARVSAILAMAHLTRAYKHQEATSQNRRCALGFLSQGLKALTLRLTESLQFRFCSRWMGHWIQEREAGLGQIIAVLCQIVHKGSFVIFRYMIPTKFS